MAAVSKEYALLALLAVMWGSSYLYIDLALQDYDPFTIMALRVTVAWFILSVLSLHRAPRIDRRTYAHLYCLALFNSIMAWPLLGWGQQYVDSSLAAILNAMPPVFVVLFTFIIKGTGEGGVNLGSMFGVLIGLLGLVIVVGVDVPSIGGNQLAQLACVLSAACYGVVAMYQKPFEHLKSIDIARVTMGFAALTLWPLALFLEGVPRVGSMSSIAAIIALSVFSTVLGTLIYLRLRKTLGPLAVSSQSYMRVLVGVGLGVLVMGERLVMSQIFGGLLVVAALCLLLITTDRAQQ